MVSIGTVGLILANNGNLFLSGFRRNEASNFKENPQTGTNNYDPQHINEIAVVGNLIRLLGF